MKSNELPGTQMPFHLEFGQGQRFVFGRQMATVIARREDLGIGMASSILSGAKGSHLSAVLQRVLSVAVKTALLCAAISTGH